MSEQTKQNSTGTSKFTGGLLGLIGISILQALITIISFTLALPWAVCIKEAWVAKHTILDGEPLTFDGKGIQLFGNYIKWFLLTLITLGIYGLWMPIKIKQWVVKHTHRAGAFGVGGEAESETKKTPFIFLVEDVLYISGKGPVLYGIVQKGVASVNTEAYLLKDGKLAGAKPMVITGIECNHTFCDEASEGQHAGFLIRTAPVPPKFLYQAMKSTLNQSKSFMIGWQPEAFTTD